MATADDHALAADVAAETGEMLVDIRRQLFAGNASTWTIKDTGDIEAHNHITRRLRKARPDDSILSEEGADIGDRLNAERVWIVDPLDGTREFSEQGRADWAVHVALVENGQPTAAAVALPAQGDGGIVLRTDPAALLPSKPSGPPRLVLSRNSAPAAAVIVARALDAEVTRLGSAGAKSMAVVMGMTDIYAHSGGLWEWDSCAPVAVARAAGLHTSRCDGSELVYNHHDPWLPDLLLCRPEYAADALDALSDAMEQEHRWHAWI